MCTRTLVHQEAGDCVQFHLTQQLLFCHHTGGELNCVLRIWIWNTQKRIWAEEVCPVALMLTCTMYNVHCSTLYMFVLIFVSPFSKMKKNDSCCKTARTAKTANM